MIFILDRTGTILEVSRLLHTNSIKAEEDLTYTKIILKNCGMIMKIL